MNPRSRHPADRRPQRHRSPSPDGGPRPAPYLRPPLDPFRYAPSRAAMNDALDPIRHLYSEGAASGGAAPSGAEYDLLRHTKAVLDRMPRPAPDPATLDAVRAAVAAHAFAPLLQAYGEAEGAPAPGSPQFAEYELLRTTKAALDTAPRPRPDAPVLTAVAAMAAEPVLRSLRQAYGEAGGAPEAGTP